MKYNYLVHTLFFALAISVAQAQVKIGNNPTTITSGALLDIEGSTTTTRTVSLTNGNFGIGTSSPVNLLDVNGNIRSFNIGNVNGSAALVPGDGTHAGTVRFNKPGGDELGYLGWTGIAANDLIFSGNGAAGRLNIINFNSVGVGTSAPQAVFDVRGDIRAYSGANADGNANGSVGLVPGDATHAGLVRFHKPGGAELGFIGRTGDAANDMLFSGNGPSARLGIVNFNSVGVGTSAPQAVFDVRGDIRAYSGANADGNANGSVGLVPGDATHAGLVRFHKPGGAELGFVGYTGVVVNDMLISGNGPSARLGIVNFNSVGIGTSEPAAALDVRGRIRIFDGTQGAGKVLTSDGNGVASWQTVASQFIPKVVFAGRAPAEYTVSPNSVFRIPLVNGIATPGYDAGNNVFVIQESGFYKISGGATFIGSSENPGGSVRIYISTPIASTFQQFDNITGGQRPSLSTFWDGYYNAGDKISLDAQSLGTGSQTVRVINLNAFLTILKLY